FQTGRLATAIIATMSKRIHLLLTRFNVRLHWVASELMHHSDPFGLDHRFNIFESFCLPSVRSQLAAFRWMVFFDHDTPDQYKDRIARYVADCPSLEPVYVEGPLADEGIRDHVRDLVPSGVRTVITTRLDNDDAIASDYLALIQ